MATAIHHRSVFGRPGRARTRARIKTSPFSLVDRRSARLIKMRTSRIIFIFVLSMWTLWPQSWKAVPPVQPEQWASSHHSESIILSHLRFSDVFGGATSNTTNVTAAAATRTKFDRVPPPAKEVLDGAIGGTPVAVVGSHRHPPPEETWLLNDDSPVTGGGFVIPPLINKIFFRTGGGFPIAEEMPMALVQAHESWQEMNPGYQVRYYDLDLARRYLHLHFHPVFLRAFDCLASYAAKSDLFRMALLYREGGWHSDWKQACLRRRALEDVSGVTDFHAAYDVISSDVRRHHKCVQTAFVGARPRHPNVARQLQRILINVNTRHYTGQALDTTGPCLFGLSIKESEEERKSARFLRTAGQEVCDNRGCNLTFLGEPIVRRKCWGCGSHHSESIILSHLRFSDVFGGVTSNTTNGTAAAATRTQFDRVPPPTKEVLDGAIGGTPVAVVGSHRHPPPEETWLLNNDSPVTGDGFAIPPLINKMFFQTGGGFPNTDEMPMVLVKAHESWQEMNPGYQVRYYDLDLARRYLHLNFHPVFLRAFDCLAPYAAKSDLFRMALLYREGGWHSDWKQACLRRRALEDVSGETDFYAAYDVVNSRVRRQHKCVQTALVGSRPRHPSVVRQLQRILINVNTRHYEGHALDTTGPCLFGLSIKESKEERKSARFSRTAGQQVCDNRGCNFTFLGEPIVRHKCWGCGKRQKDWGPLGNDYAVMFQQRQYYCEDADALFRNARGRS